MIGEQTMNESILTYKTSTPRSSDALLVFRFTNLFNPPSPDSIFVQTVDSSRSWMSGEVIWEPDEPGSIVGANLSILHHNTRVLTTYKFLFDLAPFPLVEGDGIRIDFDSRFVLDVMSCHSPFATPSWSNNSAPSFECKLADNTPITSGAFSITFSNPTTQGIKYLNYSIVQKEYINQNLTKSSRIFTRRAYMQILIYGNWLYIIPSYIYKLDKVFTYVLITNKGTSEIGEVSTYAFKIDPGISLTNSAKLYITFAPEIYLSTSELCRTTIGSSCIFEENKITINDPYSLGYACCYNITYEITGIINPSNPHLYSEICFNLIIDDPTNQLVGMENICVNGDKYTSHDFGSPQIVAGSSETIAVTHYELTFINEDYTIPENYKMRITIPSAMTYTKTPPRLNILDGLSTPISFSICESNCWDIEGLFQGSIAPNTTIQIQIHDIQNPYGLKTNISFGIQIYSSDANNSYFAELSKFNYNIDRISSFQAMTVTPNSYTVSVLTTYKVTFILKEGILDAGQIIKITVPSAIKYCDHQTIKLIKACDKNLLSSNKHNYSEYVYGYQTPICVEIAGTTINFEINCRNPETLLPTLNFTLQAQSQENILSSIYYLSVGSPITMTTTGILTVSFMKVNKWLNYPNKFTFIIQKGSPTISSDIDQIVIMLSDALIIADYSSCPVISDIWGITGSITITCSEQNITINSVVSLSEGFGFGIENILNPTTPEYNINFTINTRNSKGYEGESGSTLIEDARCMYPCKSCTLNDKINCTDCYNENATIFDSKSSMHITHIFPYSQTCVNSCPIHSYISSPASCTECASNCELCSMKSTNCTQCFPNTFLLDNICYSPYCPSGYSNVEDSWVCQLIRHFVDGSIVNLQGKEVETLGLYKFILIPEHQLKKTAKLKITSSEAITLGSDCHSTPGECLIVTPNILYIHNFLPSDYTYDSQSNIELTIYDTYTNPNATILYSEIEFEVETLIGLTIYHLGNIKLDPGSDRYNPHILGGNNIVSSSSLSTVTLTQLTFNFTNIDFSIPADHKIIIYLNSDLSFRGPVLTDNTLTDSYISSNTSHFVVISGGILSTGLPPNSLITFTLSNVLTPYYLENKNNIQVDIRAIDRPEIEILFLGSGLALTIIELASFPLFTVEASNYITSKQAEYEFTVQIGDGSLNTIHRIAFSIPITITDCDYTTITQLSGFSSSIIHKSIYPGADNYHAYKFDIPCALEYGTIIKFLISCRNPETTRPTTKFGLMAYIMNTDDHIYESLSNPIAMITPSNFSNVFFVTEANDRRPLVFNTFVFTVTRTANYSSTDIDQLQISVPEHMNISHCTHSFVYGVDALNSSLSLIDQVITISNINMLDHKFKYKLHNLQNPPLVNQEIKFLIATRNSDSYESEKIVTNIFHVNCDYPCETCQSEVTRCIGCFSPSWPVFGTMSENEKQVLYVDNTKKCVEICPSHYYQNDTFTCDLCDINCSECDLHSDNCTECYPTTFLYNHKCLDPCPIFYFGNETVLECQRCYERCTYCMNNTSTGCTACKPEYLYINPDNECIEFCNPGTFYSEQYCKACDFRCFTCFGETNTECEYCKNDISISYNEISYECQCTKGYYKEYDLALGTSYCERCHPTCKTCKGPIITDCLSCINELMEFNADSMCKCPSNNYFSEQNCKLCSRGCLECNSFGDNNCLLCNEEDGYFELEEVIKIDEELKICLYLFLSPILNLFEEDKLCKLCHIDCETCYGPSNQECTKCNPPKHLGNSQECLYLNCEQYPNTLPIDYICTQCNSHCDGCLSIPNYCLACLPTYLLNPITHDCLIHCPIAYYPNYLISICQACPRYCEVCDRINMNTEDLENVTEENFKCLHCKKYYFLNSENKCVISSKCGFNHYGETKTRTCNICSTPCLGCTGPDHFSCEQCNDNYYITPKGSCETSKCDTDQYMDKDLACQKCNIKCVDCIGPTESNCLSCQPGHFPIQVEGQQIKGIKCTPCEEIKGYMTTRDRITKNKKCEEICGDGINLGEYECDDGNKNNRDGCSNECKVEEGYICQGGSAINPDICKDLISPKLLPIYRTGKYNNTFYFQFSEPLKIITSNKPKSFVNLTITGQYHQYIFDHILDFKKDIHSTRFIGLTESDMYNTMLITLIPLSSTIQNDILEIFFNSDILSDINGNIVHGQSFLMELTNFKYLDPRDKNTVNSSGNTIFYTMIGLLSVNLLISFVCASSMNTLFPLFNMIQIITFIPLLEINLPENLRSFINDYLQFSNFKFGILTNPLHSWGIIDLSELNHDPLNERFEENGFESKVLIVNYGGQLLFWTFIIFLYIPITILSKCFKCQKLIQLKTSYEFTILLTSFSEAYLEFSLSSFLNLYQLKCNNRATCIATSFGLIGILLSFGFIVLVFNIISNIGKYLNDEGNLQKYGMLYSDTNYMTHTNRRKLSQYTAIIFLMRRFLYILIILFTFKVPIFQQVANVSIHILVFICDMAMRPYSFKLLGIMIYIFDFILAVFFGSLPLYMIYPNERDSIGRIHIYILIGTFGIAWGTIVGINIRTIWKKYRQPSIREQLEAYVNDLNKQNEGNIENIGNIGNTDNIGGREGTISIKYTRNSIILQPKKPPKILVRREDWVYYRRKHVKRPNI